MHAIIQYNPGYPMADEETVTGRLERNGKMIEPQLTAIIRPGGGISFLDSSNQIAVADKLKLLVPLPPKDRVIEFTVVSKHPALGQPGQTVTGKITSDVPYK